MTIPTDPGETRPGTLALLIALVLIVGVVIGLLVNAVVVMDLQAEGTDGGSTQRVSVIDTVGSVTDENATAGEHSSLIGSGEPFVSAIRLEVQAPTGSDPVDLSALELHIERPGNDVVLTHVSTAVEEGSLAPQTTVEGAAVARNVYLVQPKSVETVDAVMTAGDRYEIVVPTGVFVDADGGIHAASGTDGDALVAAEYDDSADVAVDVVSALSGEEGLDNTGVGTFTASEEATITIDNESGPETTVEVVVPDSLDNSTNGSVHL